MASKELVVSQGRHETKVGILEDGQLVEVYFQRSNEYSLAGSIHKGRVTRVLPGMQSAFVDLGLERDTFLYVSDFFEENADEVERVDDAVPQRGRARGRDRGRERDRDRDRDKDRDQQTERAAPAAAEVPATGTAGAVAADADGGEASEAGRDRRGRRSRRRRRGGRGFPDSKYATPGESATETPELDAEPAEESSEESEPEAEGEVIVLPGESLAKYKRASFSPVSESSEEVSAGENDEEEAVGEAIEQLLERVDELEQEELITTSNRPDEDAEEDEEPQDGPDSGLEVLPDPDDSDEAEEADEFEPPESETEDAEPEDEAEFTSAEDEESGVGTEDIPAESAEVTAESGTGTSEAAAEVASEDRKPDEEAAVSPEEGPEPARIPQSLTATLRAQGGRLGHRVSRRMRRRGRGGKDAQEAEASAAPAPTVEEKTEVRQKEPERGEHAERADRPERERREKPALQSIAELLKEGQEIIVQIAKEPLGQKGARITSHIALPGRYVVYMPTVEHLGVSRKISTDDERQRLKKILQRHMEGVPGGYIMRTAGEGRTEDDIAADMHFLAQLWQDIRNKSEKRRAPALLHHDVAVVERLLRDQLTEGFKAVWVDNEELYEQVLHSMERFAPALLSRVKLYTRPEPIFDAFGITQELEKALRPKVWLKSGGYIVINQTEALVAIDVNTGKYVGKSNRLEDTIVKTNLEAVKEIVRQMRLRDLGGIIVVDFIDMDERKNRQKVMQALEDAMKSDKAPYKILQFNDFGLVAITRKRVKQSLERTLCAPCPYCEGAGYVKSVQTVIAEILAQAQKYAKVVDGADCLLRVNPEVAKVLKSVENKYLEELEETLGRPVLVTSDSLLHQEKFDLA